MLTKAGRFLRAHVAPQHVVGALTGAVVASAICFLIGAVVYERQAKDMRWLSRRLV